MPRTSDKPAKKKPRERRLFGSGTVRQRGDGRYEGRFLVGTDREGKYQFIVVYGKTEVEVDAKLADLRTRYGRGELSTPDAMTVKEWLDRYRAGRSLDVRASTADNHRMYAEYLEGEIGRVKLQKLAPYDVKRAYVRLAERGLSASVRLHVHHFLKRALDEATNLELLTRNPAANVQPPRAATPEETAGAAWTAQEAAAFLAAVEKHWLHPFYAVALGMGFRVGELLAMRRDDLVQGTEGGVPTPMLRCDETLTATGKGKGARTVGPPKTPSSNRTLPLPPHLVPLLAAHLQAEDTRAAKRGTRPGPRDWLFPSSDGTMLMYRNLRRHFRDSIDAVNKKRLEEHAKRVEEATKRGQDAPAPPAPLPMIRLHDLRVTFATEALRQGVPVEIVSKWLGHTTPALTLKVYRKIQRGEFENAAQALSKLYAVAAPDHNLTTNGRVNTGEDEDEAV